MKKIAISALCFTLISIFTISASAENIYEITAEEFGAEAMDKVLGPCEIEISGEFDASGNYDVGAALSRLLKKFVTAAVNEVKNNVGYGLSLLALSVLCALGSAISPEGTKVFIELTVCGTAAIHMIGSMDSIVSQTVDAMYKLSDYSKAALPVVFTAAAAGGAISSSATKFAAVSFALDVLMSISQNLIVPIIYAFLALSVANALYSNPVVEAVQKLSKWVSSTLMTGMTLLFTTYISMVGAIGSAVDTAAVKTARSIISSALPIVGGMISDTSAMVLSAAGVVKNCAGVFGLIAVAAMCAGPFALLSVKMLFLKAIAAAADSMQIGRLSKLFSALSTAMGLLLGLLGSCGIMLFISLTAGMKAVSL